MQPKLLCLLLVVFICIKGVFGQYSDSIISERKINGQWQKQSLSVLSYNQQCRNAKSTNKTWDTASRKWINIYQYIYKYDKAGKLVENKSLRWDSYQGKWMNDWLYEISYSGNGHTNTLVIAYWSIYSNSWQTSQRMTDSVNDAGSSVYNLNERFDNNVWIPNSRNLNQYNSNNLVTFHNTDFWQENQWKSYDKTPYQYSEDEVKGSGVSYYWNSTNSKWIKQYRNQLEFLPQTFFTAKSIMQIWDETTKMWQNSSRSEYKYNDDQTSKSTEHANWSAKEKKWLPGDRTIWDYYPDGSVKHIYQEEWDTTANVWDRLYRTTYTHHGCNLKVSLTMEGSNEKGIPTDNSQRSTKPRLVSDIDQLKRHIQGFTYEVKLNNDDQRRGSTYYQFTVESSAATSLITRGTTVSQEKLKPNNKMFTIAPNPAKGYFVVKRSASSAQAENATLKLFDLSGKLVMVQELRGVSMQKVALPGLAKGMYMITITTKAGVQNSKLLVE